MGGSRKIKLVVACVLVALVSVLVTSCSISIGLETTVNSGGSGTIGLRMGLDKEMQELLAQQGDVDIFSELTSNAPEGWTVEQGEDPDGIKWAKIMGSFDNPDELNSLAGQVGEAGDIGIEAIQITQEKSFLRVKTTYHAEIDAGGLFGQIGDIPGLPADEISPDMLSGIVQFENRVTLPGSIKSNNGDRVEGSTVIWTPTGSGVVQMDAVAEATNWGPLIGIIAAVVFVIVVIVVVLLLVRSRRKRAAATAAMAEAVPVQPIEPTAEAAPAEAADVEAPPVEAAPAVETADVEAPPAPPVAEPEPADPEAPKEA